MSNDTTLDLSALRNEHADNPVVLSLLQQIDSLQEQVNKPRSPRQRRTFADKWEKRLHTPIDKMPLGYQLAAQWLIDEGRIEESQAGLFYACCWAYQCEEGKQVRHDGGASREALKAAREALEQAAFDKMTSESDDIEEDEDDTPDVDIESADEDSESEDFGIEPEDDDTDESEDIESDDDEDSEDFDFDSVEDED